MRRANGHQLIAADVLPIADLVRTRSLAVTLAFGGARSGALVVAMLLLATPPVKARGSWPIDARTSFDPTRQRRPRLTRALLSNSTPTPSCSRLPR
jgi:hypothetical protein